MTYLLDSDTLIHFLRGHERITARMKETDSSTLAVSSISLGELYYGAFLSEQASGNLELLDRLRSMMREIPFDGRAAIIFGRLKSDLKASGQLVSDSDLFIASTALVHDGILVTGNAGHFERIRGLRIEDWG